MVQPVIIAGNNEKEYIQMKKILIVVLAVVLVFVFVTTAFAATYEDVATWSSSVCLYGFTTSDKLEKDASDTWAFVNVGLYRLSFASTPTNNKLLFQPKSNGVYVGPQQYILSLSDPEYDERATGIYSACNDYEYIYLRITNPNSGNNMNSGGFWEGYVD